MTDFDRWADEDFHNVESIGDFWLVEHSEPLHGTANNEAAFFLIHRLGGRAEGFAGAGLHFDKYEFAVLFITADDIDLAAVRRAEEIAADREQLVAQFKTLSAETMEHQARRLDESAQARQQATGSGKPPSP